MLEMASVGAKVLQTRAVELAMKRGVRLQVLSSFNDTPGTLVVNEDEIVEQETVSGVAYSRDEAKITLTRVADRPGVAASIFGPLAEAGIKLGMINLGGGFPVRYRRDIPAFEHYAEAIMQAMIRHFGNDPPEMIVEPGVASLPRPGSSRRKWCWSRASPTTKRSHAGSIWTWAGSVGLPKP